MTIKRDPKTGKYAAIHSKRHPLTGKSVNARRTASTYAKAKQLEKVVIAQVERKILEKTVPTWISTVKAYGDHCRKQGLAEITIYNTVTSVLAATEKIWEGKVVSEITTEQIRDFITDTYGDKAPSTKKSMLKYLRVIFEYALEQGHINRNPVPKMAFRVGDKIKKVLTEEQAKLLLSQAKAHNWE